MRDTEPAARARIDRRSLVGDFFFPPGCLACESGRARLFEGGVCPACWGAMPAASGSRCSSCDLPIAAPGAADLDSPRCGRCLARPPDYDRLRAAVFYAGTAPAILKAYKYGGAVELAPHLARRMARLFGHDPAPEGVVPIPATRREMRDRGFFPAGELARHLSDLLGVAYRPAALRKVRETERQARLALSLRNANVRGAFAADRPPRSVLLVDDVATSGATLSAASRALKRAGAQTVLAAAFARALPEES